MTPTTTAGVHARTMRHLERRESFFGHRRVLVASRPAVKRLHNALARNRGPRLLLSRATKDTYRPCGPRTHLRPRAIGTRN